ncbi:YihY/virulence factor BrkB family protein [Saccharicrinis aurantiacus]|uniref:YihY/virulence factor BrkB family protein n=1 Tax=Saccharicrinis aurantiacus TaxID=1849719 RepID=UPI0008398A6B|nr:YihY/virulence factor BrkB family protein [Saccharicrinis aurantiacus]
MNDYIQRAVKYFTEDIWRVQKFELSKPHVLIINTVRIIYLAVKGFIYDRCQQKASALTFYSLLSVVPLLALILGIATGFGLDNVVERELIKHLSTQREVLDYVLKMAKNYVSHTNEGIIVGVGLVLLFWSVMKVLGNIEQSFNEIWEVTRARSFARKFTDYLAILVVGLLFLVSTSSMLVFVANKFGEIELFNNNGFAEAINLLLPFSLTSVVFTLLFYIMPNTKVTILSAAVGGIVAGILFQLLQYYYFHFQVGVSRYNSIYGSFAALPLFLIWLQSSWLIVLFGAEIAFAVQNVNSYEFEADTKNLSNRYKKVVALIVTYNVVKRFKEGMKPNDSLHMSVDLKIPIRLLNEVIMALIKAEVIVEVNLNDGDTGFIPAVDINTLTTYDVIDKMENAGISDVYYEKTEELINFEGVVNDFNKTLISHKSNILVKDM